jgi:hypothetical protein
VLRSLQTERTEKPALAERRSRERLNYRLLFSSSAHRRIIGVEPADIGRLTPAQRAGAPLPVSATLASYTWKQHCCGLFLRSMTA